MIGINDDDMEDRKFMKKIIEKTRLDPDKKIAQIEKCLDLFYDTTEKKTNPDIVEVDKKRLENLNSILDDKCNTSNKKRLKYGIEIEKFEKPVKPYYIKQPTFNNGKNNKLTIKDISRVITVGRECMSTNEWICLYTIQAENDSYELLNGFIKCAKGYGIKFKNNDSNWIAMKSNNPKDWINTVSGRSWACRSCHGRAGRHRALPVSSCPRVWRRTGSGGVQAIWPLLTPPSFRAGSRQSHGIPYWMPTARRGCPRR